MNNQNEWEGFLKCSSCGGIKPKSEFGKRSRISRGYSYTCKTCYKVVDTKRYYKNRDKRLDKERKRYLNPEKKRMISDNSKLYAKSHPERFWARQTLRNAVAQGKVKKLPCEICGTSKVQAHHYLGYEPENALKVKWLCKEHHEDQHRSVVGKIFKNLTKDFLSDKEGDK